MIDTGTHKKCCCSFSKEEVVVVVVDIHGGSKVTLTA
jgi:hypothetical protein